MLPHLNIKIQCDWNTVIQSTNHLLQPTTVVERRTTPEECTHELQVPHMGSQQNTDENKEAR